MTVVSTQPPALSDDADQKGAEADGLISLPATTFTTSHLFHLSLSINPVLER